MRDLFILLMMAKPRFPFWKFRKIHFLTIQKSSFASFLVIGICINLDILVLYLSIFVKEKCVEYYSFYYNFLINSHDRFLNS